MVGKKFEESNKTQPLHTVTTTTWKKNHQRKNVQKQNREYVDTVLEKERKEEGKKKSAYLVSSKRFGLR